MKRSLNRLFKRFGFEVRRKKTSLRFNPERFIKNKKEGVSVSVLTRPDSSVFFGYHDKIPFSADGTKILANSVRKSPAVLENECSKMELGYFEKGEGVFKSSFRKFAETTTWSWQQGCMLQWNPLRPDGQVYFNTVINNEHGAVLFDIENNKIIKEFERPVYSISPNGDIASSINFRRVAEYRPGYGYRKFSNQNSFKNVPDDDGIFLTDLNTGKSELILSIKELSDYSNHDVPHYINHVRFSPDGKKILFFHIIEGLGNKRIISFYLYDIIQKKLELLEASRSVSHFCWRNENEIFASEIGGGRTLYFLYDLINKKKNEVHMPDIGDVHPMFSPADTDSLIVDTKPDIKKDQHLFTFDLNKGILAHLGKFRLPDEFKHAVRCDLHPRWDRKGHYISIDTVDKNKRTMTVLEINN